MTNQVMIGTFRLGHENVRLYGMTDNNGGEFDLAPDDGGLAFIKVGMSSNDWNHTVSILLHETMEFLLLRAFVAYAPVQGWSQSLGKRLFVFSHQQLDDLCEKQAGFIASALPELATAWKKNQKSKSTKGEL